MMLDMDNLTMVRAPLDELRDRPRTAAATAARSRKRQERLADELRAAGWSVAAPTVEHPTTFDRP